MMRVSDMPRIHHGHAGLIMQQRVRVVIGFFLCHGDVRGNMNLSKYSMVFQSKKKFSSLYRDVPHRGKSNSNWHGTGLKMDFR